MLPSTRPGCQLRCCPQISDPLIESRLRNLGFLSALNAARVLPYYFGLQARRGRGKFAAAAAPRAGQTVEQFQRRQRRLPVAIPARLVEKVDQASVRGAASRVEG
jgi:hypothetical protein